MTMREGELPGGTKLDQGGARQAGIAQGVIIVMAGFLPIMAIVSLAPAIPRMMAHFGGVKNASTLIPLMVTAPGLMIALTSPIMGWIVDRFGRRPTCLISTLFYGLLGIAPLIFTSLPAIFASRLGLGLCEAAILTSMNTLLGDYFTPARRSFWLTVQGIFGTVCATGLVLTSGAITSTMWNGAFAVYALALPIFVAMIFFIFEPAKVADQVHHPELVDATPFPWRSVTAFSAVTLFSAGLYYVGIIQMGLAFSAIAAASPQALGLMISLASIGVPIGTLMFGALSHRLRPASMIAIYLALFGAGLVGIGLARTIPAALAMAVLQQMGVGMCVPALVFWATRVLDVRHRGRGMGFWSSAFFLGQFVSPILVGVARSVGGGILAAFVIMGVISFVGAVVAVGLRTRARPA